MFDNNIIWNWIKSKLFEAVPNHIGEWPPEVELQVEEIVDYSSKTKAQLLELAEENGVEVKKSWNKAKIIGVLEDTLSV